MDTITQLTILAATTTLLILICKAIHSLVKPHVVELLTIQNESKNKTYYIHSNDFYLFDFEISEPDSATAVRLIHAVVIKSTNYKFHVTLEDKQRLLRYL